MKTNGAVGMVLGVSGALVTATVTGWWAGRPMVAPLLTLDVVAGVLACLITPLMLWRPVPVAGVLAVLAALSPAASPPATIVALHVARRHRFPVGLAGAAAGVVAHAVQGWWRPNDGMSYGWWLALVTVGYGALLGWGAWWRARDELVRSLRERARRAEAEQGRRVAEARMLERRKIAREMHDVLAHRLSLIATFAGAMEFRPDAPPERVAAAAGVVRDGVHQALEELREVISLLRDDTPADDDGSRPQPVLADVPRLVEESRAAGTEVRLRDTVAEPGQAPPAVARTAYRVIQEALTNARKHAAGRAVRVELRGGPGAGLLIDVRNELAPDHPTPPGWSGGAGLVGLTERVHLAGGHLDHESTAGEFHLYATLPWPR
ncbi:histidine kinase [Actinoplanes sp. SE50]|uniref:sensor histidine kinase n=1 Tax=unclassified Actinoplanes TaxID=2626549 RepID=UPI00023EC273|nr:MULTISPECIES: histidine kinase [unclassified Actinoplanes]AEV84080.1 Oxygen sensor histidine kinase nreB [Actinoplanes sp. SE50/110]ATO82472.1 histidine kinase [Actinoplanes sp. SE50]SLL99879.1 two-component system sensor histidine kinase [Actinoplanes sp. SE50/110]